jgi:hypothetical protein
MGHVSASYTQQGQRAYLDSAAAVDSLTGAAAENTGYTLDVSGGNAYLIIRTELEETAGGSGNQNGNCEYQVNGGGYGSLTAATTDVKTNTGHACTTTDGTTIGNVLTTSTATFNSGGVFDNSAATGNVSFSGNDHAEFAHAVEFVATNLSDGDTVNIRIAGVAAWTNVITITISKTVNYTIVADGGSYSANGDGYYIAFDGTDDYIAFGDNYGHSGTASFSVMGRARLETTQSNTFPRLISKEQSSPTEGWDLELYDAGGTFGFYRKNAAGSENSAISITRDTWFDFCATYDGSDIVLYVDLASDTTASSRSIASHTNPLIFGKPSQFGSNEIVGDLDNVSIWNVALTREQYLQYRNRPLSGGESGLQSYWPMNEGTGSNVADAKGSIDGTITNAVWASGGVVTGLFFGGRILGAVGGSYAYTGADATLTHVGGSTYTLAADGGSYAYTGQTESLEYHSAIDALAGSYAWSGVDASLEYHSAIGALAGSYAVNGTDANLEYHQLFGAAGGAYSITGVSANLEYHQLFAADGGSYAYTGQDAALVHSIVLSAEAGSYSWSGVDANLEFQGVLPAEAGSFVWSGQDVTLTYTPLGNFSLVADAGFHGWTGVDAGLLFDAVLAAQAGAYNWTGTDVALTYSGGAGSPLPRYVGLTHSVGKLINN